jgi:hypothetical protein
MNLSAEKGRIWEIRENLGDPVIFLSSDLFPGPGIRAAAASARARATCPWPGTRNRDPECGPAVRRCGGHGAARRSATAQLDSVNLKPHWQSGRPSDSEPPRAARGTHRAGRDTRL